MSDIPEGVLKGIRKKAKADWPDDSELRDDCIKEEIDAYKKCIAFDFGQLDPKVIESIRRDADEFFESWEDRLSHIDGEAKAALALLEFREKRVPDHVLTAFIQSANDQDELYSSRLERVQTQVKKFLADELTRTRIDPVKNLLIGMESIIGNECYNGHIQNYGPWGEYEGSGRTYRYPVVVADGGPSDKHRRIPADMDSTVLITGRYVLGANELYIYGALAKVLEWMESRYGISFAELEAKRSTSNV